MPANDPTTRPRKRPRRSPDQNNSHPPVLSLTNLERHPEFWFDDGNVILITRTPKYMGFRIFRGLIAAQSTVFADMFASSSASADETLEGCPVVQLTDSHHDLVHLLRVLLPTSSKKNRPSRSPSYVHTFDELSAVIRLAHKYLIPPVQEQALRALQAYDFASDFDAYFGPLQNHLSWRPIQSIGAVNLARLTDTPLMLPAALYACSQLGSALLDGWTREDGTVEHLAPADLRRCIDGRAALSREHALLASRLFAAVPRETETERCEGCGRCAVFLAALAGNAILVETVLQEDLLTDRAPLIGVLRLKTNEHHVCAGCVQVLLERDREGRKRLWDRLPEIFGIEVEGWAKPDGEGAQN